MGAFWSAEGKKTIRSSLSLTTAAGRGAASLARLTLLQINLLRVSVFQPKQQPWLYLLYPRQRYITECGPKASQQEMRNTINTTGVNYPATRVRRPQTQQSEDLRSHSGPHRQPARERLGTRRQQPASIGLSEAGACFHFSWQKCECSRPPGTCLYSLGSFSLS